MDPERLRRLNVLLETALDLPVLEREAWLRTLPPEEQPLGPLIARLLARTGVETGTFLSQPLAVNVDDLEGMLQPPDAAGDHVGPWRLLSELGAGGMATVWLAERIDGAMQRQVALKLPLAGWSPGLTQRMVRERDILASLEHPGIARLYDAGTTAAGRPWLAMESVAGVAIDVHCRSLALDVPSRLRLFLQVAQAVAHAHARLVVHRDLKPSNILVTPAHSVRLLDFGVAKLMADEARPEAGLTQMLGLAVTPDYAAPEQVSDRPATVATDVYSLGVVLYEMLTEVRPYRLPRANAAALEAAILAADVPLASTRVSGRLARQLRGDLDNVLDKALQKDPTRRYASVESMAADVQRHLDGEPVLARPRGRSYRAKKFLARHRWPLAALSSVLLASTAGMAVALWQAHEAHKQEAAAWQSLELAEASFDFASEAIMGSVKAGESISLNTLLDRTLAIAERSFGGDPTQRAVAVDAAASWLMAADRREEAEKLLARALVSFPSGFQMAFVGELRCKRGHALVALGRHAEGVRELQAGLAENPAVQGASAYCLQRLALAASQANDRRAELDFMLRAEQALASERRHSPIKQAHMLADVAAALASNGHTDEAAARYDRALDQLAASGREDSPMGLSVRNGWALSMLIAGDPRAALEGFERVIESERRSAADGAVSTYLLANQLAALNLLAQYDEALAVAARLQRQATVTGNEAQQLRAFAGLGLALAHRGQVELANAALDEGATIVRQGRVPAVGTAVMAYRAARAAAWQVQGRFAEAHEAYSQLATDLEALGVKGAAVAYALAGRSEVALSLGHAQEAQASAERALADAQQLQGQRPRSFATARAWLARARAQHALGHLVQARESIRLAHAMLAASVGSEHPLSVEAARLQRIWLE